MAAEKKPMIVIKRITVAGAGHHGGSWKVALADFMTAMMAFFLVMWLLGQSDQTKKAISDYFSTPSVIEYNFENFGAELTLEKLFLDILNEPVKAFQDFLEPADKTPNILDMGSEKVVAAYMADQLSDVASKASVNSDSLEFDIPDYALFIPGTAEPNDNFIKIMQKMSAVTTGLKDSTIHVYSLLFNQSVKDRKAATAQKVGAERLDLITKKIQSTLEHSSVDVVGAVVAQEKKDYKEGEQPPGLIRVKIVQKEFDTEGKKTRKLDSLFTKPETNMDLYNDVVKELTNEAKGTHQ